MQKKQVWLMFKISELLLTLTCCWLLWWRCSQNNQHSILLVLYGFYGVASIICLGSMIASFIVDEELVKYESALAFILVMLNIIAIFIHLNTTANTKMCSPSILVALGTTVIYLLHCNMAMDPKFEDDGYPEPPFIMPAFHFKRMGGPQVYLCEPMPSLNGPTGLPPVDYEEI